MEEIEFGPEHPVHRRIAWPSDQWKTMHPIKLPISFIEHLTCNDVIPAEESKRVVQLRESLSVDIRDQEEEVIRLRIKLAELESELERRRKNVFACDAILSPFRRLPHDILYEIAMYLRPTAHPGGYGARNPWYNTAAARTENHPPSILSGISKSWRDVVHGTPSLWQHIHLDYALRNPKNLHVLKSRMNLSNLLSKGLPLTLHLDYSFNSRGDQPSIGLKRFMGWLFRKWTNKSLKRVHRLSVRPSKLRSFFDILSQFQSERITLPHVKIFLLRETEFTEQNGEYELGLTDIRLISDIFPNLRSFWLGSQPHSSFLPSGAFATLNTAPPNYMPLYNITTLFMQLILSLEDWFSLLKTCPHLEVAWFQVDDEHTHFVGNTIPHGAIHLHRRLTELTLVLRDFKSLHILRPFINLRFPDLSTLRINFCSTTLRSFDPSDTVDIIDYLQPTEFIDTFPALQTLIIGKEHAIYITEDHPAITHDESEYSGIYPLLLAVPSVTSLSTFTFHLQYLQSLITFLREGTGHALPNLRYLNVGLGLSEVVEPIDTLEQVLATSILGSPDDPSDDILDRVSRVDGDDTAPISDHDQHNPKEGGNRLAKVSIRCRFVGSKHSGVDKHGMETNHPKNNVVGGALAPRLEVLEKRFVDGHKMNVRLEVDANSQDGLVSDVPFDMSVEEWYLGRF